MKTAGSQVVMVAPMAGSSGMRLAKGLGMGLGMGLELTFRSNMPGAAALLKSSPVPILKRAVFAHRDFSSALRPRGEATRVLGSELTVQLEELLVGGLGRQLLAVGGGGLEGFALRGRHGCDFGYRNQVLGSWRRDGVFRMVVSRTWSGLKLGGLLGWVGGVFQVASTRSTLRIVISGAGA